MGTYGEGIEEDVALFATDTYQNVYSDVAMLSKIGLFSIEKHIWQFCRLLLYYLRNKPCLFLDPNNSGKVKREVRKWPKI